LCFAILLVEVFFYRRARSLAAAALRWEWPKPRDPVEAFAKIEGRIKAILLAAMVTPIFGIVTIIVLAIKKR
jgi:hypothetical protein